MSKKEIHEKMSELRKSENYDIFVTAAIIRVHNAIEKENKRKNVRLERIKVNLPIAIAEKSITAEEVNALEEFLNEKYHHKIMGYFIDIKKCRLKKSYKIRCHKLSPCEDAP